MPEGGRHKLSRNAHDWTHLFILIMRRRQKKKNKKDSFVRKERNFTKKKLTNN